MTRHLVQIHNIRMSYPHKEILLFNKDASGACPHVKLNPQVVVSHAYSVGQTLYMPIGSVFGANVIPHNWEAFAQFRRKKAEPAVLIGPR